MREAILQFPKSKAFVLIGYCHSGIQGDTSCNWQNFDVCKIKPSESECRDSTDDGIYDLADNELKQIPRSMCLVST